MLLYWRDTFFTFARHGDRNQSPDPCEIEISASRSNIYIRDLRAEFTRAVCNRFPSAQLTMMRLDPSSSDTLILRNLISS